MRQLLHNHFLPADYDLILYKQYHQCQQKGRPVGDYVEEFYRLSAQNNLNESEMQQVAQFVVGLNMPLQD